jgi:hypothetical protein
MLAALSCAISRQRCCPALVVNRQTGSAASPAAEPP